MTQSDTLTVAGRYENVQQICQFIMHGARKTGLDETAVSHIELACDEACTNIIEHAYGGEDVGDITAQWRATATRFTITLNDNGRPFTPNNIPAPPLPPIDEPADGRSPTPDEILANLKIGGLGIHFMRKLMDEVRYEFDHEQGNTLIMVKQLTSDLP